MINTCAEIHRMLWNSKHLSVGEAYGSSIRDRPLLEELAKALRVPDESFITSDESKGITAQQYLIAMLGVIEPLSLMFRDIWCYCARTFMRTSEDGLDIGWDFTFKDDSIRIDFENFRKYQQMLANIPDKGKFNDMCSTFAERLKHYPSSRGYTGCTGPMPKRPNCAAPTGVASQIYDLIETVRAQNLQKEGYYGFADAMGALWRIENISQLWDEASFPDIRLLLDACKYQIKPEDILSLPFWKHRWHVYELWGLVTTLQLFERRGFSLIQSKTGVALLELNKAVRIAQKVTEPAGSIYYQPSYQSDNGKTVHPDVVVVRGSATKIEPKNVAAIVECKQHKMPLEEKWKKLKENYFNEVAKSYSNAVAKNGQLVLVNYDEIDFRRSYTLIDKFRPPNGNALEQPLEQVLASFSQVEVPSQCVLIVDGSRSMNDLGRRLNETIRRLHDSLDAVDEILWLNDQGVISFSIDSLDEQIHSLSGGESTELFIQGLKCAQQRFPGAISHLVTDLEPESPVLMEVRELESMPFSVHCLT